MKVDLHYSGPLFGRVKGRYCDLVLTSKDVDKMERQHADLLKALQKIDTYLDNAPTLRVIARRAINKAKGITQ